MRKYLFIIFIVFIYFLYSSYNLKKDVEKSIMATDKVKVCGNYLGIKSISGPTRGGSIDYIYFKNDSGVDSQFYYIPKYHDKLFDLRKIHTGEKVCYFYSLMNKVNGNFFISQIDTYK